MRFTDVYRPFFMIVLPIEKCFFIVATWQTLAADSIPISNDGTDTFVNSLKTKVSENDEPLQVPKYDTILYRISSI